MATYKSEPKHELAALCIKHRLYSPGGLMRERLVALMNKTNNTDKILVQMLPGGKFPAAVILIVRNRVMIYVSPDIRRCGFGTELLNVAIRRFELKRPNLRSGEGIKGAGEFFWRNGIKKDKERIQYLRALGYAVYAADPRTGKYRPIKSYVPKRKKQ